MFMPLSTGTGVYPGSCSVTIGGAPPTLIACVGVPEMTPVVALNDKPVGRPVGKKGPELRANVS